MSSLVSCVVGQISVAAGIVATAITLLVGSIVGVIAGYYGGLDRRDAHGDDRTVSLSLPWLYFLLGVTRIPAAAREPGSNVPSADLCNWPDRLGATGAAGARSGSERANAETT